MLPKTPVVHTTHIEPVSAGQLTVSRGFDFWSLLLIVSVWICLGLTSIVLLFLAHVGTDQSSDSGEYVSVDEIYSIIALCAVPSFISIVLNEMLVERCWRRIELFALSPGRLSFRRHSIRSQARNLRAANFGWFVFIKRAKAGKLSLRDLRVCISWLLLRWGSSLAITSTQICVKWIDVSASTDGPKLFMAEKRIGWIVVPPILHALAVFGTLLLWIHSPFALFISSYNDEALWEAYQPYVMNIAGGSAATADEVADLVEGTSNETLARTNKPGMQFVAKIKGTSFGLLTMNIAPAVLCVYTYCVQKGYGTLLRSGVFRFVMHSTFLIQYNLYVIALDFIVWNLSIEGLCKTSTSRPQEPKKKKHMRYLGNSTGLMMLLNIFQQRRPWRAWIMLTLFSLQAFAMIFLVQLYGLCASALSYGPTDDQADFNDPYFWIAWSMITCAITYPLVIVWLLCPFQAPICEQDRWRWAKINTPRFLNAGQEDVGFYGVVTDQYGSRAAMDINAMRFFEARGIELM